MKFSSLCINIVGLTVQILYNDCTKTGKRKTIVQKLGTTIEIYYRNLDLCISLSFEVNFHALLKSFTISVN